MKRKKKINQEKENIKNRTKIRKRLKRKSEKEKNRKRQKDKGKRKQVDRLIGSQKIDRQIDRQIDKSVDRQIDRCWYRYRQINLDMRYKYGACDIMGASNIKCVIHNMKYRSNIEYDNNNEKKKE